MPLRREHEQFDHYDSPTRGTLNSFLFFEFLCGYCDMYGRNFWLHSAMRERRNKNPRWVPVGRLSFNDANSSPQKVVRSIA